MMRKKARKRGSGGYKVGKGRPPLHTRWKPGQSGNPKGRPKGSRPVGAILQEIIQQKVPVTENGKARRIPALEVMLRRLANDAMRSDQKAIKFLLTLVDRYAESPETTLQFREILAEDEAILARYLREPTGIIADPPLTSGDDDTGV
jgi:Family of unknown function (DUF5681)